MRSPFRFIPLVLFVSVAFASPATQATTRTDDDVAAAKRDADYAEAVARQKDAEKASMEADAAIANTTANATIDLQTSQNALDKARVDLYKSLLPTIPDPSKYKVSKPETPNLTGTATSQLADTVLDENKGLVIKLTEGISKALPHTTATILIEDSKTRTSVALYKATKAFLQLNTKDIQAQTNALEKQLSENERTTLRFSSTTSLPGLGALLGLNVISSAGELAASFATILKTQYGTSSVNQTTAADLLVTSAVIAALGGKATLVDPDAIINSQIDPTSCAAASDTLICMQANLMTLIAKANTILDSANAKIAAQTAAAKSAQKKDFTSPLADPTKKLSDLIAAVSKQLVALYVADAQGTVPFDVSQKGELIADILNKGNVFMLSIKVLSADVDVVASDALFKKLHVGMSTSTVAKWRLVKPDGVIAGSDVVHINRPWTDIPLPR